MVLNEPNACEHCGFRIVKNAFVASKMLLFLLGGITLRCLLSRGHFACVCIHIYMSVCVYIHVDEMISILVLFFSLSSIY